MPNAESEETDESGYFVLTWCGMAALRDLLTMHVCCQAIMAYLKQTNADSGYMLKFIKLLNMLC